LSTGHLSVQFKLDTGHGLPLGVQLILEIGHLHLFIVQLDTQSGHLFFKLCYLVIYRMLNKLEGPDCLTIEDSQTRSLNNENDFNQDRDSVRGSGCLLDTGKNEGCESHRNARMSYFIDKCVFLKPVSLCQLPQP